MIGQFTWIEIKASEEGMSKSGTSSARFGHSVMDDRDTECGVAAGWDWDGHALVVESDLHGYIPLYFSHSSDRIIVSDSPLPILARQDHPETDPLSLGFFCRAGFLIGDRTLFRGIERVPGRTRMKWTSGSLDIHTEPHASASGPTSVKEAVDGWIDRFQVAVSRRLPSQESFDIPLSGGRDSRMILLELERHGRLPGRALALGSPNSDQTSDFALASQLAHRLGIPFEGIRHHEHDSFKLEHERHVACGFEALEHVWLMPLWNELLAGGRTWFDGLGVGSLTRNAAASPEMTRLLRNGDIAAWSREFFALTAATTPRWLDPILECAPMPVADADEVVTALDSELARHIEAPNPITSFTFENWGRRSIALNPLGICRSNNSIALPLMDRDLVSWARSIPVEMMHQDDIQTTACHRLYPLFSDLPFDDGSPPMVSKASPWLRYRRKRRKKLFFKDNAPYFGTLPFEALNEKMDKSGSHRALILMFHLACVDSLLSGE